MSSPADDPDPRQRLLAGLAELLPGVVTEGRTADGAVRLGVDLAALRDELGDAVLDDGAPDSAAERYRLEWPGKRAARALTHRPRTETLVPDRGASVDFDVTGNLFIEGDNLAALRLLTESYRGRIRLVYADPPYNTGSEFVYADDYSTPVADYLRDSGQADADGGRLVANPETAGRRHSAWLSMIYPRLRLIRELLAPDGLVMISIDDIEVANLRRLCDEVFGEQNFVAQFVWTTKNAARGVPPRTMVMANHEYVVVYARDIGRVRLRGLDRDEADFANPDGDPRGLWRSESMKATGVSGNRFTIVDPATGIGYPGNWAFSPARIEQMIADGLLLFPPDGSGTPRQKKFIDSYRNPRKAFVTSLGWYSTEQATKTLMELFDGRKVFDFPKPVELLGFLIDQATEPDRGDIVLDCFAGSAATAEAVLTCNAADGGDRRFILCQLPEAIPPARNTGFATIADLGRERIRRAGKRIADDLDRGFRALRVAPSMRDLPLPPAAQLQPEELAAHADPIGPLPGEQLLFELMVEAGLDLTAPITVDRCGDSEFYEVGDGDLIACLADAIPEALPAVIADRRPRRAVLLDRAFPDDAARGNAARLLADRSPGTVLSVI